ncbi:immunoglobulin-binding protein 1-like [Antedon mediterranea]|uniref:immunoglobulin-binding protein 1-like n=1 Tax=Antedon mediterranea TaxID=105859 RepID=UPI003AF91198
MSNKSTSENEQQQYTLSETFDHAWKHFEDIKVCEEATNSVNYQQQVSKAIAILEKATHMVNDLALFSSNEQVDEISTQDLRYLLLPSLLGELTLKVTSGDRLEMLDLGEAYFIDYLKRCKDYSITEEKIPTTDNCVERNVQPTVSGPGRLNMKSMQMEREAKLKKYKEQKEREKKIKEMGTWLQIRQKDDEIQRDYYKLILESCVNEAIDQIKSISQEKEILQHMAKSKSAGSIAKTEPSLPAKERKPIKPFIITRDSVQAKVFGAGYPSIPTVTLEEFFQKEVRERKIPQEALNPSAVVVEHGQQDDEPEEKPEVDENDPEELKRARELDEWKDDHKRGWGNRYNRS